MSGSYFQIRFGKEAYSYLTIIRLSWKLDHRKKLDGTSDVTQMDKCTAQGAETLTLISYDCRNLGVRVPRPRHNEFVLIGPQQRRRGSLIDLRLRFFLHSAFSGSTSMYAIIRTSPPYHLGEEHPCFRNSFFSHTAHHLPRNPSSDTSTTYPGRRGSHALLQVQTVLQRSARKVRVCL